MKWDNDLPSAAAVADFIAGEPAGPTPRYTVEVQHVRNAGLPIRGVAVAKAPVTIDMRAPAPSATTATVTSITNPSASPPPGTSVAAASLWLDRLNYYRTMAGLATLRDDRQLSASLLAHAHYVLVNFSASIRDGEPLGVAIYGEDPAKSGYTRNSSSAAENSQFAWGCGLLDVRAQIDQWIAGPFHRLEMLNPLMTRAGFGEASANGCWVAALRLPPPPEEAKPYPHAIEFPPDGTTVALDWHGLETPDPLTSCDDYKFPAGLPITLQLGWLQSTQLSASSLTENGRPIEHCAFDSHSYRNPNGVTQEYGRWALHSSGAVVLIPREPLNRGAQYSVSITAHGHTYTWTFKIAD
ncbi:MAG: CAP domain-containing protein [Candidatus Binataceae bacterium]